MPNLPVDDPIVKSLLAGLASDNGDAADERFAEQLRNIGPDDMLLPPTPQPVPVIERKMKVERDATGKIVSAVVTERTLPSIDSDDEYETDLEDE